MPPYVNPITQPYGNIATVNTDNTDRAFQLIYQQEQQKQRQRAAEQAQMDDMINGEYGKIKSIDVPELADRWNNYKQIRQRVLYDKKLQKDPAAYQQAKIDAERALGEVYRFGNASKEILALQKQLAEDRKAKPEEFEDDFGQRYNTLFNTRTSQLGKVVERLDEKGQPILADLTNPDYYRYKGGNYDFTKSIKDASGLERQVGESAPVALDKQGLQTQVTPYFYGNTPSEFRNYIGGVLTDRKASRTAALEAQQYTPEMLQQLETQYNSIPADELSKRGLKKLDKLPEPRNAQELWANVETMKYAIAANAREGKKEIRGNEEKKLQAAHNFRLAEMNYANSLKGADEKEQENNLEKYIRLIEDDANNNGYYLTHRKGNTLTEGKQIKLSPDIATALSINVDGKPTKADAAILLPNGDWQTVIYKRSNPKTVTLDDDVTGKSVQKISGEIIKDSKGQPEVEVAETILRPQVKANVNKYFAGKIPKQVVAPKDGSVNISEVPSGTKLEKKKGKYYYQGKEVIL